VKENVFVVRGDITKRQVDAIVNAANEAMLGGGGVDGAIHRAAGRELLLACRAVPEVRPGVRCPTGEARLTPAFNLPAKWIVHTVGPVWRGGGFGEESLLAKCYANSLELASKHGVRSIAFPAISTGVFRYPVEEAARVAYGAVRGHPAFDRIELVCFGDDVAREFERVIS
jgi:O-acetyl-ADP-ribose deacetylase (regulator of RNase III)